MQQHSATGSAPLKRAYLFQDAARVASLGNASKLNILSWPSLLAEAFWLGNEE